MSATDHTLTAAAADAPAADPDDHPVCSDPGCRLHGIAASNRRQSEFYAANDRTVEARPDEAVCGHCDKTVEVSGGWLVDHEVGPRGSELCNGSGYAPADGGVEALDALTTLITDVYTSHPLDIARVILASDWLAAHDAEVARTAAKEAGERIAQAIEVEATLRARGPDTEWETGTQFGLSKAAHIAREEGRA